MSKHKKITLPCLKGKMGDWFYYVTLLSFSEVANRVRLPKEIDKYNQEHLKLEDWIQREIEGNRIKNIVHYLRKQDQRFFNSLILGMYEGHPSWQEIEIFQDEKQKEALGETVYDYLSRSMGILTLDGSEIIFAIDGQHRAFAIREAVKEDATLKDDEISVIFVAHKTDDEGKIRTRRLFSTLNKYAKPVHQSEIIALSEDNNCSIITRDLVDHYPLFKGKLLVIKNRSINPENETAFTNIMVLYDIIERLLTDKSVVGIKVSGKPKNKFITERAPDAEIEESKKYVQGVIREVINHIPSLSKFFETGKVNRKHKSTSLLFRPIGQNIFFDILKVVIDKSKKKKALDYFSEDTFNLSNSIWKKIFWDEETQTILTEKSRQRYATLLILEHLGIEIRRTKKDQQIFDSFGINPVKI